MDNKNLQTRLNRRGACFHPPKGSRRNSFGRLSRPLPSLEDSSLDHFPPPLAERVRGVSAGVGLASLVGLVVTKTIDQISFLRLRLKERSKGNHRCCLALG